MPIPLVLTWILQTVIALLKTDWMFMSMSYRFFYSFLLFMILFRIPNFITLYAAVDDS